MNLKPTRPRADHNPLTGRGGANTYRSQCKRCGLTVHTWQNSTWSRDPHAIGIVHADCEDPNS